MNQGAYVTLVGYVAREPNLRDAGGGVLVADMRVGTAGRVLDKKTGQWKDVEPQYFTVTCWRKTAGYANASFRKGDPVFVRGRMRLKNYIDKQERPRTDVEVLADVLGLDVSRTVVNCVKGERPRRDTEDDYATGEENRDLPPGAAGSAGSAGQDWPPDEPGAEGSVPDEAPTPPDGPAPGVALNEEEFERLGRQLTEETEAELAEGRLTEGQLAEAEQTLPAF